MADIDTLLAETTAKQRAAAEPDASVWVAANAGSGKTKVLTDRVMRLLLAGSEPSKLLCITFTKAAAAEMADRLFRRLGDWALMSDDKLAEALAALDGGSDRSAARLSAARKLFARALETPGGLKIQTIHSFCEGVLKRFPVEAGIAPGFSVIEEGEALEMQAQILNRLAERLWSGAGEGRAEFLMLTGTMQEDELRRQVGFLAGKGTEIERAIVAAGGPEHFYRRLAGMCGHDPDTDRAAILATFTTTIDTAAAWLTGLPETLQAYAKNDQDTGDRIAALLAAGDAESRLEAAGKFALTSGGTLRKKQVNAPVQKAIPGLEERLQDLATGIDGTLRALAAERSYACTAALYRLARIVHQAYTEQKRRRGVLDFEDLIARTAALFRENAGAWVLYKLDQGIDHLLVDEAQDTSPGQWQVIEGPLREFFSGIGAGERNRTVFVVGDEKQSIYSFQGADVSLFNQKQGDLHGMVAGSERAFSVQDMILSFRSTAPVLDFVDEAFRDAGAAKGVSERSDMRHHARRGGHAGRVDLWPLVLKQPADKGRPWDLPVDMKGTDDPARVLATHIAATIKGWLDTGEVLPSRGRAVRPSDVLILCQRRSALFHEIDRELVRHAVPAAGSDRIKLLDHPAARDLLAATRFALQHHDNLSLAELLKSPLFGFTEEELFEVAWHRVDTLWQALLSRAAQDGPLADKCRFAGETLKQATATGLARGPYAFFAQLLETGSPSGWRRFYDRLGSGARDPLQELLSEALAWENRHPRSLQLFLGHLEALKTDLKKEQAGGDNLVRLMTVHGSKGLEAPIVFLADSGHANYTRIRGLLPAGDVNAAGEYVPEAGYYIQPGRITEATVAATRARDHAVSLAAAEYRRLFYVAATRAEDRLYICGTRPGRGDIASFLAKPSDDCSWYALAHKALERLEAEPRFGNGDTVPWGGAVKRLETPQTDKPEDEDDTADALTHAPPGWLTIAAAREATPPLLSPSRLGGTLEADEDAPAPAPAAATPLAAIPRDGLSPFTRGNALHLLLERLADLVPEDRAATAARLLARHYPDQAGLHDAWTAEVLAVLEDPAFSAVFATGSRAEVPVMGAISGTIISGQIDRLAISGSRVLIVDYKTNRPPPSRVEDVHPAYLAQLAAYRRLLQEIYPDHEVDCALLWTWEARLMPVSAELMDHALLHHLKAVTGAEKP